jgi:hypothetical protein
MGMRVLLVLAALSFAPSAAAESVAVLPLLTPEGKDAAGLAEATFRRVLSDEAGWDVQARETTAAEVEAAVSLGMKCVWDDVPCLARTGIVLRVERLVSGHLSDDGQLTFILVESETGEELERVSAENPAAVEQQAAVAAQLARELAGVSVAPTPPEAETERGDSPSPDDASPETLPAAAAEEVPWLLIGGVTAGVGAGIATLALSGALALEGVMQLTDMGSYDDRLGMQASERALVVGAGFGVVVGVVGGAMLATPLLAEGT